MNKTAIKGGLVGLLLSMMVWAVADTGKTIFQTDLLQFGQATNANKVLTFKRATLPSPGFRWNESQSAMQFSNDGTNYLALGAKEPVVSKSVDYTLTTADGTVLVNASGAARTMTLPTAVGNTGQIYTIKKTDSSTNRVNIATTSSQTIDGETSDYLTDQYEFLSVQSDGANWNVRTRNQVLVAAYYASANTSVGPANPLNFDGQIHDAHSMVTTGGAWHATIPKAGYYTIAATCVSASTFGLQVWVNGFYRVLLIEILSGEGMASGTGLVKLAKNDSVSIRSNGLATCGGGALASGNISTPSVFWIQRVGN